MVRIDKDVLIKYLIMTLGFMFIELLFIMSDNMMVHVAGMVCFSVLAVLLSGFDLIHPYTWFSTFFCLYSIGLPVLTYVGSRSLRASYTKELMDKEDHSLNLGVFNKILYVGLILILLGGAFFLSRSGLGGKANIYASGSSLLLALFRVPLILTMLYALLIIYEWKSNKQVPIRTMVITGISLFGITIFSGERDFVFRFIIITAVFLFCIGKLKRSHIIMLAPIGVMILILSDKYKYFFSTGIVNESSEGVIFKFFAGEFESASTNLQIVISQGMSNSLGIERYILDIASAFTTSIQSVSSWFSDLFYRGRAVQYGFSIIGEGYVIGGVIGVVFISIVLGAMIKFFYKRLYKGTYWFASYLYFITIVIYSIRMDLGTILSAIVKQIGIVLIIVMIAEKISKKELGRGMHGETKERLLDSNHM